MPRDLFEERGITLDNKQSYQPRDLFAERGITFKKEQSQTPLNYPGAGITRSFKTGVEDITHGLLQPILENLMGEKVREGSKRFAKEREKEKAFLAKEAPIQSIIGNIAGKGLVSAPAFMAAPQALLPRLLTNAAIGFGTGVAEYGTPEERLQTGLVDALGGAVLPEVIKPAGSLIGKSGRYAKNLGEGLAKRFGFLPEKIAGDIVKPKGLSQEYLTQALEKAKGRQQAGKEIGVQLTPGEAFQSKTIAQKEAGLGKTAKGGGMLEEFYETPKTGRYAQENQAVDNFFKEIGVNPDEVDANTSREIRDLAKNLIEKQKEVRSAKASPYYKEAFKIDVPQDSVKKILDDEVINDIAKKVYKKPVYKQAIKSKDLKSGVEFFQPIKESLDDQISVAKRNGQNNLVKKLMNSKNNLLNELDKVSPDYKTARKIFSDESTVVSDLMNSNLGKIASLDDKQLKNVANILFDPAEIDPTTRKLITDNILKTNPRLYYDAVAQKMFKKIDTLNKSATNRKAPSFYRGILAKDQDYNFWREALKYNPGAVKRLDAMKEAFEVLGGDFTPRAAAKLEKTSMLNPRDILKGIGNWLTKEGLYDQAAIKFITDPNWVKEADKILKMPKTSRPQEVFKLIGKIGNSMNNSSFAKKSFRPLTQEIEENNE